MKKSFRPTESSFVSTRRALSRRKFLQGAGVVISLPFLDAMLPNFARGATAAAEGAGSQPRRMLGICNNLSLLHEHFFPQQSGRDYALSPYLELLKQHRDDFTVFSGVSHPGVDNGHYAEVCFLSAAPHPGQSGFRNTVSLDQYIAERIGSETRFPSLTLGVNADTTTLSYTSTGVAIPAENRASTIFRQMFVQGTPAEIEAQMHKLHLGGSILDSVADQAKFLQRDMGTHDRDRLDQYFTSVRELERQMADSQQWAKRPKPKVNLPIPVDPDTPQQYMTKVKLMYDLARLAFETDSTRSIALMLNSRESPAIQIEGMDITYAYHSLSHHGQSPDKLVQLKAIDEWHMRLLAKLFDDLKAVRENGESLLDRTMVVYGSNLGNGNTHSTTNLPVLFAGGGFRHGQHLAFDTEHNYPLPNLFLSVLQRMGLETDRFASSKGTMRGLEVA